MSVDDFYYMYWQLLQNVYLTLLTRLLGFALNLRGSLSSKINVNATHYFKLPPNCTYLTRIIFFDFSFKSFWNIKIIEQSKNNIKTIDLIIQ